ncbi:Translation initiation factor eIF-2B subunit gamma [Coemansia spiralis]|uniref:Translation initiation factor eIF2B subunit gamma n=2 Tax=Coemansia TaxID=4863 RepID=A0A9W8GC31_9FUNG|nr:nucleotide-diphospho-sugar transferase [Coemansia spiralis]KAJ1996399.1 Translation initiation factor eIF-2B subunit gamma [Coemansia umbellata]KAJ2624137.1 Translation initiation factor eIF-2B subunit gamma [Coemansia sp. RSA 1358]KAJ2680827.1 Translation initiation factor eIF-2B subunit gamma [Coemansia spiralis]
MFSTATSSLDSREPEFKAVVLALQDDGMYPLTERENMPKALLPIANKPMLWYVLQWLEQGGILDIKIVTTREAEADILNYIEVYKGISNITVKCVNEAHGSADILRQLAPQIRSDVIVVPCDLIVDVPTTQFLDIYRMRRPAIATLFYEIMKSEGGGGSTKASNTLPIIGIDQPSSRLVFIQDIENNEEEAPARMQIIQKVSKIKEETTLPMSLVRRFPSMALSGKMQDSHVYVLQKWVLDYIAANTDIASLQDDLLPLFVQAQCNPQLLESRDILKHMRSYFKRHVGESNDNAPQFEQPENTVTTGASEIDEEDPLKVFAYLRRGGIAGRADQVPKYCDLNSVVARISLEPRVGENFKLAQQSQIGADSIIGASSQLDERCLVKRSVVGAHCIIGKNVNIINSVIMDHVTVGDGVDIVSCVVCKLAKIGNKVQLRDCEIGATTTISDGVNLKGIAVPAGSGFSDDEGIQTEFV